MKVIQSGVFFRTVKKLHKKEKTVVDHALKKIIDDTSIGDMKKGALTGVRVYKFKVADRQYLLAYRYEKKTGLHYFTGLGVTRKFLSRFIKIKSAYSNSRSRHAHPCAGMTMGYIGLYRSDPALGQRFFSRIHHRNIVAL